MKKATIISPCGNEKNVIIQHIEKVTKAFQKTNWDFELLVIFDNYCTDGSYEIVNKYSKNNSNVKALFFEGATGLASCYLYGYKVALETDCTHIIEMDVESHPPKKIPEILNALEKYDMVLMSRVGLPESENRSSFYRKSLSFIGTFLSRVFLQLPFKDCTSGYQAFSRDAIESINLDEFVSTSYFFQTEMKAKIYNLIELSHQKESDSVNFFYSEKKINRFFRILGSRRFKYTEIPFVYDQGSSGISYKKVWLSFKEFIKYVLFSV